MAIEVQTTQNVIIDYEPAGVGYRMLAYIIDWIAIGIWVLAWLGILFRFDFDTLYEAVGSAESFIYLLYVIIIIPIVFYDLLFETLNKGQSIGKMICRIRVINTDGTTPSFGAYLLRWLFRVVDFSMTNNFLAFIMVAATEKSQRLGDIIAGTTVIDLKMTKQNRELRAPELDFDDNYKVTYPDILYKLSDKDIQTILAILNDEKMWNNDFYNSRLADRIRFITGYQYAGPDRAFLKKIIDDYNFLALQT